MIYFTADPHWGHFNIIRYTNRPFESAPQMDAELIKRWNSKVTKSDTVYLLGDVFFGKEEYFDKIISQLNFEHLHVIKGNHDKPFARWYESRKPRNVSFYGSYLETRLNGRDFTLCHYALRVWNKSHHNALHLYGHSHGTLPDDPHNKSMDVGVDTNSYYPYSFDEVVKNLDGKKIKPLDHHGSLE